MNIRGKWMPEMPAQKVGQISGLQMRTLTQAEEAVDFQQSMQQLVMDRSKHHIPAVFHIEGLCGAYVPGDTSFPTGLGQGSGWDPELKEEIGRIVGRQERAYGIPYTLAPVLDLGRFLCEERQIAIGHAAGLLAVDVHGCLAVNTVELEVHSPGGFLTGQCKFLFIGILAV